MSEQRKASTVLNTAPLLPLPDSGSTELTSRQRSDDEHNFSKGQSRTSPREMQSYLMTLDDIDIETDEKQTEIFTRHTIDAVCASLAAARHRVRQYTQLAKIYQLEADDWAVKLEKAGHIMPDYKPVWLTSCLG